MRKHLLLLIISLGLLSPTALALNLNDGLWEITSEMSMEGMPMEMPPHVARECLTRETATQPPEPEPGMECSAMDTRVEGDTVHWYMDCVIEGQRMTGGGEATYHGDTMRGRWRMEGQVQDMAMAMQVEMSGHRVGSCE